VYLRVVYRQSLRQDLVAIQGREDGVTRRGLQAVSVKVFAMRYFRSLTCATMAA
jgi:hypothetical protein